LAALVPVVSTKLFLYGAAPTGKPYAIGRGTNSAKLDTTTSGWAVRTASPTLSGGTKVAIATPTVLGPTSGVEANITVPLEWITAPIDQEVTIAGTITFNLWMGENATANNAGAQCVIQRLDSTGAIQETVANSEKGTELPKTSSIAAQNWTVDATDTQFHKGDRIRIRVAANDAGGTMAADATGFTLDVDGQTGAADGDSFVTFTETFSFLTTDPTTTTIYPTTTAGQVDPGGATVDTYEVWTSRGSGVTTGVTNTTAGWTAPIQVTTSAGGNAIEWFTRGLTAFTLAAPVLANVRGLESDTLAQSTFRAELAVTANDGTSPTVWAATEPDTELTTSEAVKAFYLAGADTAITNGQRLRLRIYIDDYPSVAMAASKTVTLYYAGTSGGASGDSFLTFGQTLTEYVAAGKAPPFAPRTQRNFLLRR
jgi:hypothetical protein